MFSFMASQAIALSQAKQEASKAPASRPTACCATHRAKASCRALFDAMVDSRMRRAEIELRYYRGLHEESSNK